MGKRYGRNSGQHRREYIKSYAGSELKRYASTAVGKGATPSKDAIAHYKSHAEGLKDDKFKDHGNVSLTWSGIRHQGWVAAEHSVLVLDHPRRMTYLVHGNGCCYFKRIDTVLKITTKSLCYTSSDIAKALLRHDRVTFYTEDECPHPQAEAPR